MQKYLTSKDTDRQIQMVSDHTRKRCKTFLKREDYFVRFKTDKKKEFATFLDSKATAYQVALEGDNETNYHIQCAVKFKSKDAKLIKKEIKEWYKNNCLKPKIKTYYSCVTIRTNAIRVLAYNLKQDSQPLTKNVDEEDIKIAKMLSHGKDLRQLSKRLEDLKERYFRNEILDVELTKQILLLKAEFNQNIYLTRIESQVRYIMIKKYPDYAYLWATEIVNKIKNDN